MSALVVGDPDALALVDADHDQDFSFGHLKRAVERRSHEFQELSTDLLFLFASLTATSVIDYLAARDASLPVVLLDPALQQESMESLVAEYQPGAIAGSTVPLGGYHRSELSGGPVDVRVPTSDIAPINWVTSAVEVLLPTSGSTGNPKLVQLGGDNLNSNAIDIASALGITQKDRGLAPLPLFYSYGLSILNSHLSSGATTILTAKSPLRPEFWQVVNDHGATSIPGVPYSYQIYERVGMADMSLPTVRYLSQAGGRLDEQVVVDVHESSRRAGRDFFVMYGQTEASPRMSTLPSDELPDYAGSVGYALEHGSFEIEDPDENGIGEIAYEGPNVMVGYAHARKDLGVRTLTGRLLTGDLGRLDDCGRLTITGRMKRIAKLYGTRFSLDDIESRFTEFGLAAAVEGDNCVTVFFESSDPAIAASAKLLERHLRVPPKTIRTATVESLPLSANGKVDYRRLADEL